MAGTLEIPTIGSPNSTQDPKIKSSLETLNGKLNAENLVPSTWLADGAVTLAKLASVIRGRVKTGGEVNAGTGFTSEKTETGIYVIKFTTEYSATPLLLVTPETGLAKLFATNREVASPKKEVKIAVCNDAGELKDSPFGFEAKPVT